MRDVTAIAGILRLRVQFFDERPLPRQSPLCGEIDVALVVREQRVSDRNLLADRRDRQHLVDDAPGDREVRRLRLPPLRLGLRDALLGLTTQAARRDRDRR